MAAPPFAIRNTPEVELRRSPAAAKIGTLAARSGLFLTHFEHRRPLSLPDGWLVGEGAGEASSLRWVGGKLKEDKFLHFRYDQPLGSFHPNHQGKWGSHELCHGLVGFVDPRRATPFTIQLSARLSEVLPVALWYFFDEIELRRCPKHHAQGALFGQRCERCEWINERGPRLPEEEDQRFREEGLYFLHSELAAVNRSRRYRHPVSHRYSTVDLCSDGLQYARRHFARISDPLSERFIELFHGPETGCWPDLETLEERVLSLSAWLAEGAESPPPLLASRERWIAQDIASRIVTVAAGCADEDVVAGLEALIERLALHQLDALPSVASDYDQLQSEWVLPSTRELLAVGYPLPGGWGSDPAWLAEGVRSVCPHLEDVLGPDGLEEQLEGFLHWDLDRPMRQPLACRFADYLTETAPGPLADIARYESSIAHPGAPDLEREALGLRWIQPSNFRRAEGVKVCALSMEIEAFLQALESEDEVEVPERHHQLLIVNHSGGERAVTEISDRAAGALERLRDGPLGVEVLNLNDEELRLLIEAGALVPCDWLERVEEQVKSAPAPLWEENLSEESLPLYLSEEGVVIPPPAQGGSGGYDDER